MPPRRVRALAPLPAFRYVLELPNGDNTDPMMFVTEIAGRQIGDTFLAGPELQRFRILAIDTEAPGVLAGHADAIWIVQPEEVGGGL
jgi:hypothetical protein